MYRLYPYIARKYWYFIPIWLILMGTMRLTITNQAAFRIATAAWVTYTLLWLIVVSRKNAKFGERRHQTAGRTCIYCGTDLTTMSDPSSCYLCHKPNKIA